MTVFERVLRGEPPPVHRAPAAVAGRRRHGLGAGAVAGAAGRRRRPARARRPRRRARVPRALLARGERGAARRSSCWPATPGSARRALAAELAAHAHGDGAVVLYGRFDEETLTPYQPVVEMLRGWSAGAPLDSLRDRLGPRAAELAILLPEFGPPPADHLTPRRDHRPRGRRAALPLLRRRRRAARRDRRRRAGACWSSTTCTGRTGRRCSCCATSCARPRPRRVLFVGTYRESEITDRHPLHELVGDLRREGTLRRLELAGLGEAEVGELVAELASAPATRGLRARARTARPRATRSSSRRSCATSATPRAR